jgi:hypothetical protein
MKHQYKYNKHYVCDNATLEVLAGPMSNQDVVDFINSQQSPEKYCNMSRTGLSRAGMYPKTKAGDMAIEIKLAAH